MAEPFGGVKYGFKGQTATLEQVMGPVPITATDMTKKLWAFIKGDEKIKVVPKKK